MATFVVTSAHKIKSGLLQHVMSTSMSNLNLHTEFQYDDLGNPFICNSSGTWVPYLEYAWVDTPSVPHDVPSAHLFMGGDLGLNTCHYIRQRPANEPFIQHQNAGGGSTLILPATFPDGRDASSNTPGGVDSCIDLVLFPSLRAMTVTSQFLVSLCNHRGIYPL